MSKRQQSNKASLKLFEDVSSRESTPDPYCDDGEFGSDEDYDPEPMASNDSDSSVSSAKLNNPSTSKIRTSVSDNSISENDECSINSCSIFGSRRMSVLQDEGRSLSPNQNIQTGAEDIISAESLPGFSLPTESPLPTQPQPISIPSVSPQAADRNYYEVPIPSPLIRDMELQSSPPPTIDVQNNFMSAEFPSHEDIANSGSPSVFEEIQVQPSSAQLHSSSRLIEEPSTIVRSRIPRQRTPPLSNEWEFSTADIPSFEFDTTSTGIQFELGSNATVLDVFNKILPPHIIDYIISCTNDYGRALCSANRPTTRNARNYRYKETNREEMLKFLGLSLLMGHVKIPKKKKLFTYTDLLYFHPIFQYTMSARRNC
jgi:hypothetical protein